jgi:glutathione S-transferase
MITLHHLNNSRSQRIIWLLEELNLSYEIKFYQRDLKTMLAPKELKQIHPLGKSPVITDGTKTIAESAAIIDYLVKNYGDAQLGPNKNSEEEIRYSYWLHYSEGSAMPPVLLSLLFNRLPLQPMTFFIRPIIKAFCQKVLVNYVNPQLELHLNYIESELVKNEWFCGNKFTAADIQMSFPLEAMAKRYPKFQNYPRINKFLEKIHSMEKYKLALEKGGPYDLLS